MAQEEEDKHSGSESPTSDQETSNESESSKDSPNVDEKYCKSCGEIIDKEAEICPECGVRQKESPQQNVNVSVDNKNEQTTNVQGSGQNQIQGSKSKILAAVLAVFLGNFGIHKFYLGQIGQGILYVVFSWTFIPALLELVDAARYLLMSKEKFHRVYG